MHMHYQRSIAGWPLYFPTADYDVGLIELIRGSVDLAITGRAKLYAPSRPKPWSTSGANRDFVMIGWCNSLAGKYIRTDLTFDDAHRNAESIRDYIAWTGLCPAFSGTPWLLKIGEEYLVIAVQHGGHNGLFYGYYDYASLITTKTRWIWDASRSLRFEPTTGNYTVFGLSCGGASPDPNYIECFERDGGTVVPPPPMPSCPAGRRCCERMGDDCRLCIPADAQCP